MIFHDILRNINGFSFFSLSEVASSSTAEGGLELKAKQRFVDSDTPSEIKASLDNKQEPTNDELA